MWFFLLLNNKSQCYSVDILFDYILHTSPPCWLYENAPATLSWNWEFQSSLQLLMCNEIDSIWPLGFRPGTEDFHIYLYNISLCLCVSLFVCFQKWGTWQSQGKDWHQSRTNLFLLMTFCQMKLDVFPGENMKHSYNV